MGILDSILGRIPSPSKEEGSNSGGKLPLLNLEKPLSINLVKSLRALDLNLDKSLFILDISGSMASRIKGKRKIDSLREVMEKIPNARIICFSSQVYRTSNIPEPNGSTKMDLAFNNIGLNDLMILDKIVLISDGEPDNVSSALSSAKVLKRPIDVIYIGEKGDSGEIFMDTLAKNTGGRRITI